MKDQVKFQCQECMYSSSKWFGKCPECDSWHVEEVAVIENKRKKSSGFAVRYQALSSIELETEFKYESNYKEFDRVLGSGLVKGSVTLISGSPGIGKSTLLLQVLQSYTHYGDVLYVTGEESIYQIKQRSNRLKIVSDKLHILAETEIDRIEDAVEALKPKVIIIDSIQTVNDMSISSSSGSSSQIKEGCSRFIHIAKTQGIPIFMVGHVTKDGKIAGPKLLEHMVDTVLNFEGESSSEHRILRAIKNRYGATNELAVFEMNERGMHEVSNLSEYFLGEREKETVGSVATPTQNGNRVFLVELQTLITRSIFGMPRRIVQGVDFNKFQLILAVLEKKLHLPLMDKDVFINVPGGMSVKEPSIDLSIAVSIFSSIKNLSIVGTVAFIGEIGLRGEVRKVSFCTKRVFELENCGFKIVYVPIGNKKELALQKFNIKIVYVTKIEEALEKIGCE